MKKHFIVAMVMAAMMVLPLGSALATDVFISATETVQWDPDRAYEGYNLFVNDGRTWLVDMEGRIVNEWDPKLRPLDEYDTYYDETGMGMYQFTASLR